MQEASFVRDMVVVIGAALVGGLVFRRLGAPTILGYLLGGVLIGPFGLRLVGDRDSIETLANLGVILLMFALGVQLSLREVKPLWWLALLGGGLQMAASAGLGWGLAYLLGRPSLEAAFFGFIIALSSTMIVVKVLLDRGELDALHGRVLVAILLFQDLSVVPIMAFLPVMGEPGPDLLRSLGLAGAKGVGVLAATFILGTRLIPWLLSRTASLSRELFIISVVALGLGAAWTTNALGLSLALGAFLAGLVVSESDFAHQALADVIPLRDIFALLFFVSVGMLVDPNFVRDNWTMLGLVILVVMLGKLVIGALATLLFGYDRRTSLLAGAGLMQIGEFSFLLALVGLEQGLLSEALYSVTLAAAVITIALTPLSLSLASWVALRGRLGSPARPATGLRLDEASFLSRHVVIGGYGRVGSYLGRALEQRRFSYLVVDLDPQVVSRLKKRRIPAIFGDVASAGVLDRAGLDRAGVLVLTTPDPVATRLAALQARRLNPNLDIVARVASGASPSYWHSLGVREVVQPEKEAGLELVRHTLHRYGVTAQEIQHLVAALREEP